MDTIVLGYLDTPTGDAALEAAIEECDRRRARLSVVTSNRGAGTDETELLPDQESALERVSADLESRGIAHEVHHLVRGKSPAEDLSEHAEEIGASLIVIGYRRRTPTGKFLLGSDSRDVLLSSPCSVLCVLVQSD
jgi:nucleotide-binding universal stress UspA family protein